MSSAQAAWDCLLITRPQPEAADLADRISIPGLLKVLQPAHEFSQVDVGTRVRRELQAAAEKAPAPLLVFTSTRAVQFALQQVPLALVSRCQLAAIGSATAAALQQAGLEDVIQPDIGYRSEDLLNTLDQRTVPATTAWIVAAAGGRKALMEGLQQRGLATQMLLVYRRHAAEITAQCQQQVQQSQRIFSVWTSADAMQLLSRRFSALAWSRVCAGEWLVISDRLAGIAEKFRPAAIHQSDGPGNAELAASIEQISRS